MDNAKQIKAAHINGDIYFFHCGIGGNRITTFTVIDNAQKHEKSM